MNIRRRAEVVGVEFAMRSRWQRAALLICSLDAVAANSAPACAARYRSCIESHCCLDANDACFIRASPHAGPDKRCRPVATAGPCKDSQEWLCPKSEPSPPLFPPSPLPSPPLSPPPVPSSAAPLPLELEPTDPPNNAADTSAADARAEAPSEAPFPSEDWGSGADAAPLVSGGGSLKSLILSHVPAMLVTTLSSRVEASHVESSHVEAAALAAGALLCICAACLCYCCCRRCSRGVTDARSPGRRHQGKYESVWTSAASQAGGGQVDELDILIEDILSSSAQDGDASGTPTRRVSNFRRWFSRSQAQKLEPKKSVDASEAEAEDEAELLHAN